MAEKAEAEAEAEYESDFDDAPLPAVRRRAAASDDEEEEDDGVGPPPPPAWGAGSEADSDGQGAAEVYEDEEDEVYEEYEEAYEEFDTGGGGGGGDGKAVSESVAVTKEEEGKREETEKGTGEGEEKGKGNEPYAVPTTGAFYMHDDRFQESGGRGRGRQRRMFGVRKIWNPKDEQAWVHDRFDEMNLHEPQHDNSRKRLRGRFRGQGGGSARGVDHGYFKGNRSQSYYGSKNYCYVRKESHTYHDNDKNCDSIPKESHTFRDNSKSHYSFPKQCRSYYDEANNSDSVQNESHTYHKSAKSHNNAPKVTRGRGSRHYQPRWKSTVEISSSQNNKSQNPEEAASHTNMGKLSPQTSSLQPEHNLSRKQAFASNLNSASPPFYPSRSSHHELSVIQRGNAQTDTSTKPFSSSVHSSLTQQSGSLLRGKAFVPSVGYGKFHVEDFDRTFATNGMHSDATHSSASPSNNLRQYSASRGQGRGVNIGDSPNNQFSGATSQVNRVSTQSQNPIARQRSVQTSMQSASKRPAEMPGLQFSSSKGMPSSPLPTLVLSEDGEAGPSLGSDRPRPQLPVKAQNGTQREEKASFLYGGAHVLGVTGPMGFALGDQGFAGTPALLPVMQFGSQHSGGPGVPSIAMALPGFVAQQQLGVGNSEMTWLPVLTGAAGALGATYGSPLVAHGSYRSRPSEQLPSPVSPREPSATKAPASFKLQEIPEAANDELSQRQNKPRRYSEMNFGQ